MKNTLVATVMSNMGLERHLNKHNIELIRTNVGDRYVVEAMRKYGYNLGGEQSGHIVMTDFVTTGDGLMAGLQFLNAMVDSGKSASDLINVFEPMPQLLKNILISPDTDPLENTSVQEAIREGEAMLGERGRLLIRKSGTEPLVRVMGECEDSNLLSEVVMNVAESITSVT
jgi:phosphoglucosamine mutase